MQLEPGKPTSKFVIGYSTHKHYDEMKREGKRAMLEKQQSVTIRSASLPGRNDPCSCGSGKKYKKYYGSVGG